MIRMSLFWQKERASDWRISAPNSGRGVRPGPFGAGIYRSWVFFPDRVSVFRGSTTRAILFIPSYGEFVHEVSVLICCSIAGESPKYMKAFGSIMKQATVGPARCR